MDKRYWEEMAGAMSFLSDVLVELNYSPAQVRRVAEIVRESECEAVEVPEMANQPE